MDAVFSPVTNKAYFKKNGRLYNAPFDSETKVIDFEQVSLVDWFFLTPEETEDAFNILSIMEEDNEV